MHNAQALSLSLSHAHSQTHTNANEKIECKNKNEYRKLPRLDERKKADKYKRNKHTSAIPLRSEYLSECLYA